MFSFFKKKRYATTYKTRRVEHLGHTYTVRELLLSERVSFGQFASDEQANPILICSWLVSRACDEFLGSPAEEISTLCGPSTIQVLADEIIDVSGMAPKAVDNAEKKSVSSPN